MPKTKRENDDRAAFSTKPNDVYLWCRKMRTRRGWRAPLLIVCVIAAMLFAKLAQDDPEVTEADAVQVQAQTGIVADHR
jgi:hypothetical protein